MLQKLSRVRGLSIEEKSSVRLKPGSHTGRTLGDASGASPLAQLAQALRKEKTRFIVVGMTAAILQGTPSTPFDVS